MPVASELLAAPSAQAAPLSILFLVDQLTEMGGGERMLLALARALAARGHAPAIVTFQGRLHPIAAEAVRPLAAMAEARPGECPVCVLPLRRVWDAKALRVAGALRGLIRARQPAVVHTFFETADLFGGAIALSCGAPALVSSRRDMGILRRGKHALAYRLITRRCGRVLAVSDQVRAEVLRRDHGRPARVLTIPNGVDLAPFLAPGPPVRESRAALGLPPAGPLITTIANLQPWKRLDWFLACAALVLKQQPDVHFAIAGQWSDTALHGELLALAASLGIAGRVHFLGPVPHAAALLRASTVFCLLSGTEGFPNVVLEAMAAGLPVVATRVGGTPEAMLEGQTGFLVEPGDHGAAAGHVLALLADQQLRARMGRCGFVHARECFSLERMVDRHESVYQAVLEGV